MTERTRRKLLNVPSCDLLLQLIHLPLRKPKGDPANIERIRRVAVAFHQWRMARLTAQARARHAECCTACGERIYWRRQGRKR